jgi:phosphopantothenoylcysteine decarboxylase/phosphopantothenate--cysteine ligase
MAGKRVLVTAGPTREYLDPVRFISNPSSGKMGLAMARTAWYRGAEVRVILGPVPSVENLHGLEVRNVVSAVEMRDSVMESLDWADCVVKAAAVGDYRASSVAGHKIKREIKNGNDGGLSLTLEQNPDIAAEVGAVKRPGQFLIGFAAETEDLVKNARAKMERKGLDLMLANDVSGPDGGFESDFNTVRMMSRAGGETVISGAKEEVADAVWEKISSDGLF